MAGDQTRDRQSQIQRPNHYHAEPPILNSDNIRRYCCLVCSKLILYRQQFSRHAFPDSSRLFRCMLVDCWVLLVMGNEHVSFSEVCEWSSSMWVVSTEQDLEGCRSESPMCVGVQ